MSRTPFIWIRYDLGRHEIAQEKTINLAVGVVPGIAEMLLTAVMGLI
ncbi:MAG: hypothetical protein ACSLEL_01750 [Candidatus Malihini olakiniferum]